MKKLTTLLFVFGFIASIQLQGQSGVSINANGTAPDASAILDVSSTDQGMLVPRMTEVQRDLISSPAPGLMIYQTDGTKGFYHYDGSWTVNGFSPMGINALTDGKAVGSSMFLGSSAGVLSSGIDNVGIGINSLALIVGGVRNTAIGYASGSSITGDSNILIGQSVTTSAAAANNELNIGNAIYGTDIYATAKIGIGINAPNSTLDVDGSVSFPINSGTTDYLLLDDDYTYLTNGGDVTLPTAGGIEGRVYIAKNIGTTNKLLLPQTGELIDGAVNQTLTKNNKYIMVQSDGSDWWIIGRN